MIGMVRVMSIYWVYMRAGGMVTWVVGLGVGGCFWEASSSVGVAGDGWVADQEDAKQKQIQCGVLYGLGQHAKDCETFWLALCPIGFSHRQTGRASPWEVAAMNAPCNVFSFKTRSRTCSDC